MDLADHLPLSHRRAVDETGVSSDWSTSAAEVLRGFAALLDPTADDASTEPTTSTDSTGSPDAQALVRAVLERLGRTTDAHAVIDATTLRSAADELEASSGRVRVETLGECLADLVLAGRAADLPVRIDPVAAGAAVLARALSGPSRIRGLVRGRTLVATDGDWRLGSGPVLERTCAEFLVLFYRS
ncbi:hypothetical protein CLV46_2239 [Diaminobutyricimonas aerilata]|uniref:Uncharacterized protein n=1 Tax=Diaminobutyricimonas aerilata TaxID=1162967 RepID=A0A2M9CL95_9MICO|nr:hypothetical protein [Diaminobutyricimonas aerilata]PJJ72665.1 hypothetical protein CLV46_2239 [Diaminobutyricimonas aerilata]